MGEGAAGRSPGTAARAVLASAARPAILAAMPDVLTFADRGIRRRRGLGTGFALSDHVDRPGLNEAIRATGASRVFVTHGYTAVFRRWLEAQGYDAGIVETGLDGDEAPETAAGARRPAACASRPPGSRAKLCRR